LAKYSKAVETIVTKLTPEEKKQAMDLALDWNENGLSKDVQVK
jgi:hypothetical protein